MSARNGDKSRFHRQRKQKIAARKRIHEQLSQGTTEHKSANVSARAKPRSVSA